MRGGGGPRNHRKLHLPGNCIWGWKRVITGSCYFINLSILRHIETPVNIREYEIRSTRLGLSRGSRPSKEMGQAVQLHVCSREMKSKIGLDKQLTKGCALPEENVSISEPLISAANVTTCN